LKAAGRALSYFSKGPGKAGVSFGNPWESGKPGNAPQAPKSTTEPKKTSQLAAWRGTSRRFIASSINPGPATAESALTKGDWRVTG